MSDTGARIRRDRWPLLLCAMLGTALAYGTAAYASLALAIAPSTASPLFPAAGIALACAMRYGWRVLPAVAIGSLAASWTDMMVQGTRSPTMVGVSIAVAAGVVLQAGVGAALVRRFMPGPVTLAEPLEVVRFYALGATSCLVSASLAVLVLRLAGVVPASQLWFSWSIWWAGDWLGVLIAAPVVLALIGQPASEWRPRIAPIGITLAACMLLVAVLAMRIDSWDSERIGGTFERDAAATAALVTDRLKDPQNALLAMHGIYIASDAVSVDEFRRGASPWIAQLQSLHALGWVPLSAATGGAAAPSTGIIEPATAAASVSAAVLSRPEVLAAIQEATRSGRVVASAAFMTPQPGADRHEVLVFRAVYAGTPGDAEARSRAVRGVVFAVLMIEDALSAVFADAPDYLAACIVDTGASVPGTALLGSRRCSEATAAAHAGHPLLVRVLPFGGRQWRLFIAAERSTVPGAKHANAWLFAIAGQLGTAALGALLLAVTGRTRRIESAVRQRTAALTSEMRDRLATEGALRDSETRFRNIFNNAPIGIVYTDIDGRVMQANPQFCALVGRPAELVESMNESDFVHPEDRAAHAELTARLIRGELPLYRRNECYLTGDGAMVRVRSVLMLLRDARGSPHRIVSVVEDITEHLRLEDAERARDLAESSNQAKSEFLSRMSHELRTPLNAMLGFAQLLGLESAPPLTPTQREWTGQIESAGWHLLDMINDVLDLSRIDAGTLRLTSGRQELAALLAASWSMVAAPAAGRGIVMMQDLAECASKVQADATRLKQILTNLLSNAVKYNIDGGRIQVRARRIDSARIEITVADTGLGMTPAQLAELFQPFNRLGRESSPQQGTGIGLVISRRLAELMGGSLHASSEPGAGASFMLVLPAVADAEPERPPADALPAARTDYRQRCVHYIEDNETNVEVMRGILAQRPQVEFEVSMTGHDGLAAIRSRPPDLVLLDMHLPDSDGMALLRELKADPATAAIPVYMVSADALPVQVEAAHGAGAAGYLTKPVNIAELLAVVDAALAEVEPLPG